MTQPQQPRTTAGLWDWYYDNYDEATAFVAKNGPDDILVDGIPWPKAKDIADALNLAEATPSVDELAEAIQDQKPHTCDDAFKECAAAILQALAERRQREER